MSFPQKLRQLRREHGLTQEQLGKKIGVSKVSISGYENGIRTPDVETLKKLADVFDIPLDELVDRSNSTIAKERASYSSIKADYEKYLYAFLEKLSEIEKEIPKAGMSKSQEEEVANKLVKILKSIKVDGKRMPAAIARTLLAHLEAVEQEMNEEEK